MAWEERRVCRGRWGWKQISMTSRTDVAHLGVQEATCPLLFCCDKMEPTPLAGIGAPHMLPQALALLPMR